MKPNFQYFLAILIAFCLFSSTSQAQSNPPAWSATTNYKIGDLVTYVGNTFQCLTNETESHPNPHQPGWRVTFIYTGNFSIPVGPSESFKTLTTAWAYIAAATIVPTSTVVLKLDSNYNETFQTPFSLNHPFGSQISIMGVSEEGPTAQFAHTGPGFTLTAGHSFGTLENLDLLAPVGGSGGGAAIQVTQNSVIANIINVPIQLFDIGLIADTGGTMDNVSGVSISSFATGGIEALTNATIIITNPITVDGSGGLTIPAFGIQAVAGTIHCEGCTAENCQVDFVSYSGGKLLADNSIGSSPATTSYDAVYYAYDHGTIRAKSAKATGADYSFESIQSSFIDASYCTAKQFSYFAFDVNTGATIDATNHNSGATGALNGSEDGSYIFGL